MSRILARSPGKVVLIGEYAVLHGAPALAMAVDRHAKVRIEPCRAGQSRLAAPQLGVEPLAFRLEDGRLQWDVEAPAWPVLKQTASLFGYLHGLAADRFGDPGPFQVEIDTADLFLSTEQGSIKLGLGSSSAVAVALDAGLRRFAGGPEESGLSMRALERMLKPYRRGQDGQGSGIDLASCLCGGVISYRWRQAESLPEVSRRSLPPGLLLLFVFSGQPASTPELLARYQAWRADQPAQAASIQVEMERVCEAAQLAMVNADAEALVEHFQSYGQLIGTMGGCMNVELMGAGHGRIRAEAERKGLAYKPCGAGLGDIGMLATTDPARLSDMRQWLDEQGFPVLDLAVDAEGVIVAVETD
jgi:phosphomevalonate kinase